MFCPVQTDYNLHTHPGADFLTGPVWNHIVFSRNAEFGGEHHCCCRHLCFFWLEGNARGRYLSITVMLFEDLPSCRFHVFKIKF